MWLHCGLFRLPFSWQAFPEPTYYYDKGFTYQSKSKSQWHRYCYLPGSHSISHWLNRPLLLYGNSRINPRSTVKHWDEIKHKSRARWDLNKVFVHFIRHYSPSVLELSVPHMDPEENRFHATSTHASTCAKMFYDTTRHARKTSRQRKVRMMDKSMLYAALLP